MDPPFGRENRVMALVTTARARHMAQYASLLTLLDRIKKLLPNSGNTQINPDQEGALDNIQITLKSFHPHQEADLLIPCLQYCIRRNLTIH